MIRMLFNFNFRIFEHNQKHTIYKNIRQTNKIKIEERNLSNIKISVLTITIFIWKQYIAEEQDSRIFKIHSKDWVCYRTVW